MYKCKLRGKDLDIQLMMFWNVIEKRRNNLHLGAALFFQQKSLHFAFSLLTRDFSLCFTFYESHFLICKTFYFKEDIFHSLLARKHVASDLKDHFAISFSSFVSIHQRQNSLFMFRLTWF